MAGLLSGTNPTPEQVEAQVRLEQKQALRDRYNQAVQAGGSSGGIGFSLGNLLSGVGKEDAVPADPRIQSARQNVEFTQALQQIDMSTPEGLREAGRMAQKAGRLDVALDLSKRAREAENKEASTSKLKKQGEKLDLALENLDDPQTKALNSLKGLPSELALARAQSPEFQEQFSPEFAELVQKELKRAERKLAAKVKPITTSKLTSTDVKGVKALLGDDETFEKLSNPDKHAAVIASRVNQRRAAANQENRPFDVAEATLEIAAEYLPSVVKDDTEGGGYFSAIVKKAGNFFKGFLATEAEAKAEEEKPAQDDSLDFDFSN